LSTDRIELRGLRVLGRCGVLPLEREQDQPLDIDVDLDRLAALDCPVLLVRGDRDPAVDPAQYAELRQLWPQSEELVVPAGHHDVQLTRRRIVQPAILDFLDRAKG
jgi:pimeloyl-ACP methyl ester carboxylesterase